MFSTNKYVSFRTASEHKLIVLFGQPGTQQMFLTVGDVIFCFPAESPTVSVILLLIRAIVSWNVTATGTI